MRYVKDDLISLAILYCQCIAIIFSILILITFSLLCSTLASRLLFHNQPLPTTFFLLNFFSFPPPSLPLLLFLNFPYSFLPFLPFLSSFLSSSFFLPFFFLLYRSCASGFSYVFTFGMVHLFGDMILRFLSPPSGFYLSFYYLYHA